MYFRCYLWWFSLNAGELRHISRLKPWKLYNVLVDKYNWSPMEADSFADFLLPMLAFEQDKRISAADALKHYWLTSDWERILPRTTRHQTSCSTHLTLMAPSSALRISRNTARPSNATTPTLPPLYPHSTPTLPQIHKPSFSVNTIWNVFQWVYVCL